MSYWITIDEELSEVISQELWEKIRILGANITIMPNKTYVYGEATDLAIKSILYECALLEKSVQLNIKK